MLTSSSHPDRYKGPTRQKVMGDILDALYNEFLLEQRTFLEQRTGYGRCLTGDGATVQRTKYINFLCHEYQKGVMLCGVHDCTARLTTVGTVEATFIAHQFMGALRCLHVLIMCLYVTSLPTNILIFIISCMSGTSALRLSTSL